MPGIATTTEEIELEIDAGSGSGAAIPRRSAIPAAATGKARRISALPSPVSRSRLAAF